MESQIHNTYGPRSTAKLPSNSRHRSTNRGSTQGEGQGLSFVWCVSTVEQGCLFLRLASGPRQRQQNSLWWGRRLTHSSQGGPQSKLPPPQPFLHSPARNPVHKRAQGRRRPRSADGTPMRISYTRNTDPRRHPPPGKSCLRKLSSRPVALGFRVTENYFKSLNSWGCSSWTSFHTRFPHQGSAYNSGEMRCPWVTAGTGGLPTNFSECQVKLVWAMGYKRLDIHTQATEPASYSFVCSTSLQENVSAVPKWGAFLPNGW